MNVKKKILITGGKVHDVGYRLFLMREVRKLGIPNHYAENVTAGGKQIVEVFIGGDEKQYTAFVNFIKENYPPKAKVSEVKETSEIPDRVMPVDEYDKLLSAEQQDTIVQSGLELLDKQDQALGKQDKMLDKQDKTLEKQDKTLDKQDKMLEKQDKMLEKQDKMLEKQDKMLEKQDKTLNVLSDIKSDTSQIRADTSQIKSDTSQIRSDTSQIRADTSGIPGIDSNTGEMKETLAFGMSEIITIKRE